VGNSYKWENNIEMVSRKHVVRIALFSSFVTFEFCQGLQLLTVNKIKSVWFKPYFLWNQNRNSSVSFRNGTSEY